MNIYSPVGALYAHLLLLPPAQVAFGLFTIKVIMAFTVIWCNCSGKRKARLPAGQTENRADVTMIERADQSLLTILSHSSQYFSLSKVRPTQAGIHMPRVQSVITRWRP